MERIENDLLKLQFLREEHHQRYQYVASFAKGVVVDCACGIGYSAPIILSNPAVVSYTGLDVDREAIAYAQEHNTTDSRFEYGSILALPFDDCAEVKRVLKPNGIFICSVPTKDYENFCVSLYGPNPYHIQAFSLEALKTLLQAQFSHVDIAVIAQELVSIVHTFQDQKMPPAVFNAKNKNVMNGSFIAISSNVDAIYNKNTLFTGMSRIEYDQELVSPLRQSLEFAERLAEQRIIKNRQSASLKKECKHSGTRKRWSVPEIKLCLRQSGLFRCLRNSWKAFQSKIRTNNSVNGLYLQ